MITMQSYDHNISGWWNDVGRAPVAVSIAMALMAKNREVDEWCSVSGCCQRLEVDVLGVC